MYIWFCELAPVDGKTSGSFGSTHPARQTHLSRSDKNHSGVFIPIPRKNIYATQKCVFHTARKSSHNRLVAHTEPITTCPEESLHEHSVDQRPQSVSRQDQGNHRGPGRLGNRRGN